MLEDPSFIPDTNYQFDWSPNSLGALKKCPRYYFLTKIEGWQGKGNPHLSFGIWYTEALERYDWSRAEGVEHEDALCTTVAYALQSSFGWDSDHKFKNREVLIRSIVWYLESYRDDAAKTVILSNGSPAVELKFSFDTELALQDQSYILSGRIDKLVDFGDIQYVLDHKTTGSTLGSYYFDQYNPDIQVTVYTLASRLVYKAPVQGVIIDAAQTAIGFTAFSRGIVMRSDGQLDEFLSDFSHWMEVARYYSKVNHWPMNEASCNNYGGCAFRGICNKDPAVRQAFLSTAFEKRTFDMPQSSSPAAKVAP